MKLIPLTLIASFLFSGTIALADPPRLGKAGKEEKTYKVRDIRDVTYYDGKGADLIRHKLDLFLPKDKKDFPVLVFVHGGAWMLGDKSSANLYSNVGKFLASRGIGVVLPNYRLSPWVRHPEHVRDVARAYAWVHKNIAEYGGDPDRMFIGGHSAGGHLAALLATDDQYLKAEGLSRKNIRGVLAISGVYRIPDSMDAEKIVKGVAFGKLLGGKINPFDFAFPADCEGRDAASPVCHVCAGLPPCLIVTAEHDLPLLPEMADEFARALKGKKCEVQRIKVDDRNHMSVMFDATTADDPVARAMLDFIARHGGK